MILRMLDNEEVSALYRDEMRRDFPLEELKSLQVIHNLLNEKRYEAFGAFENGREVGYALMYLPGSRIVLLDYLAISPDARNHGEGKKLMECIRKRYAQKADAIVIECEDPSFEASPLDAERRIHFYEQLGAKDTGVTVFLYDVEYRILYLAAKGECTPVTKDEIMELYTGMLQPKEFVEKCMIH